MALIDEIHPSWQEPLNHFSKTLEGKMILSDLSKLLKRDDGDYHPPRREIFAAFRETHFNDVKVVIIGQDPYLDKKLATGLAFSMPADDDLELSPSIEGIHSAMENDLGEKPPNGNLDHLARQGVLLLNRVLTFCKCKFNCRKGCKVNIHRHQGWEAFTRAVVKALAKREGEPIHFVLWGEEAYQLKKHINNRHHILPATNGHVPHPAVIKQASKDIFRQLGYFNAIDNILKDENDNPIINWIRDPNPVAPIVGE